MNPQLKDRGGDNVLPDQGYLTPQGAVIDEYKAMVELWAPVEREEAQRETCCSITSSTMDLA
jgi:hypothetical protein